MHSGLEILELDAMGSDYVRTRVTLNGVLAIPFEFLKSDYVGFKNREEMEAFLERQALTLIESYGDARECRPYQDVA